ncbi:MAG TPA: c-type cytochrome [Steroidobacteraceae bacterium]|jgi:cytochrome c oxidase subunit 2|nr:c-type cytochrome [Steroidobacteraceae bacterium]
MSARRFVRLAVVALAALTAAGCSAPMNYMIGNGGVGARSAAWLGWQAIIAFCAATLVTWAFLLWFALRRRGTLAEHEPIDINHGQAWILIGGFLVPIGVLIFLFTEMMVVLASEPVAKPVNPAPDIVVSGQQWWWDASYRFKGHPELTVSLPTEIHIPVGKPMMVEVTSGDVMHSFWVPKLNGKIDLIPGRDNYEVLEAVRPGTYLGQCASYCGEQHANMKFRVIAQTPSAYQAWLAHERAPAAAPESREAQRGEQVFMGGACGLCHTIRGTPALGQFGPDLTHLASRQTIAGGMLPNDTADLEAWITHAQSLKPGTPMPDLPQFRGSDLRALVRYLQGLK